MLFEIRNYRQNDLEPIVTLHNAADTYDGTKEGTSIEETRELISSPDFHPEKNIFVVEAEGRVVGYATLRMFKGEAESSFRTWYQVHPRQRGRGIEEQLLTRLYARAEERLANCNSPIVDFFSHANLIDRERIAILERFGLREARRFWQMVRVSLDDLPAPVLPRDITARPYRIKEDDEGVNDAINAAFRDHWGHTDDPLEQWRHFVASPMFQPELTIVAENAHSREIAGVCIILVNDEENARLGVKRGWIEILGVLRPYRNHGLGTALIIAGMHNLQQAGMQQAALGADSENLTGATRLYERAGFTIAKTRVAYRKRMRGA